MHAILFKFITFLCLLHCHGAILFYLHSAAFRDQYLELQWLRNCDLAIEAGFF